MIASIYARKSTEQIGVNEEEKSVARQIDHAKAYAMRKGWTVSEDVVFMDDGISGAEFVKRPGFLRLMNALKPKPTFQFLIMSEESRLGREAIETSYALKQIIDAGVRVFFYLEDRERTLDNAMDKVMLSLTNFAAEMEREKASQRTHDAMLRKAKALYVTGCRVFGYDNVNVYGDEPGPDGERKRLHVVRQINKAEAAIVRKIFERYATGIGGLCTIAKELNGEGILPPRGHRRGWDSSCIREILYRPLYRGLVIWNKTQTIQKDGTQKIRKRPESEWVRIPAPDLRVVSEAIIQEVDKRLAATRTKYVRTIGGKFFCRPSGADLLSAYLLSGLAMCAWCEGSLVGLKRGKGHGKSCYLCVRHDRRGAEVCANDLRINLDVLDTAVITAVRRVIEPDMIRDAIALAVEQVQSKRNLIPDQQREIQRDLTACECRIKHLVDAIGTGKATESVFAELQKQEAYRTTLTQQLQKAEGLARFSSLDAKRMERNMTERASDLSKLLGEHLPQTRQVLRRLIRDEVIGGKRVPGRIVCTPIDDERGRGYSFLARGSYSRLLGTGIAIDYGGGGQGS